MHCPNCNRETSVVDTRRSEDNSMRRRRECKQCRYRFTTTEQLVPEDRIKLANTATAVRGEMQHLITLFRQLDKLAAGLELSE